MASSPVIYAFGEFQLDRDERVLRRGNATVPLTPKATEILLTLIDHRGHIVEKSDLMSQVWPDTAVEEGNLSQNIYTLRRVLSNGDGKCPFIETVPRRGYRFVGSVRMLDDPPADREPQKQFASPPTVLHPGIETSAAVAEAARSAGNPWPRRRGAWMMAVLGTGLLGAGVSWWSSDRSALNHPTTAPASSLTRATNVGNVVRATITGDGRSVVYAVITGARESLWAKDLDSGKLIQLVEPAVGTYRRGGGIESAPDGSIYYTWFRPDLAAVGIYRVPRRGGRPELLRDVQDLPAFDPQGTRFACITTTSMAIRESRLLVYDAAGQSSRVVSRLTPPMTFLQMRPAWSPDGRQLAVWTSSSHEPGIKDLVIVGVEDGRERVIAKRQLHTVDGMEWLPDGQSVVVAAREAASAPLRLWRIALDSGAMRPLTTDISDYMIAGLTSDGQQLAAVRVDVARSLWLAPLSDLSRARQVAWDAGELSELESLAWMPDGRMLYTSTESGNADIWIYDPATDTRRPLTTHARDDFNPASSLDGTIVFASDRSGATGLWAMTDSGERSARQLTGAGDSRPTISPHGDVVFQRGTIQSAPIELWQMPLTGGTPVRFTQGTSIRPAVSPDGRLVAYYWMTPERWTLAVARLDGRQPVQIFPLSPTHCGRTVRWSPDSRSLAYIDCDENVANIWLHRLDGSPPSKLTDFRSGHITTFDWSRDGSQLGWITRNQVSDVVLIDLPRPAPGS
jgi:DNA-binding winged helix-turn-helix (wHTH) protein/Tol biopolymer transport system component